MFNWRRLIVTSLHKPLLCKEADLVFWHFASLDQEHIPMNFYPKLKYFIQGNLFENAEVLTYWPIVITSEAMWWLRWAFNQVIVHRLTAPTHHLNQCWLIVSEVLWYSFTWGHFKNVYELLNLRALKISMLYKNHIFQCMGMMDLTHTLKDVDFIHRWKCKSS